MLKDGESSNVPDRKSGLKTRTVLQITLFAIVIGFVVIAAIYLRRPIVNNSASSSSTEGFTPDRNFSQGDLPRLNSAILAGTEQFWMRGFEKAGKKYRAPTVVLFEGSISSVCGFAKPVSGPFYCPRDERIYIDLSVTRELINRLGMDGNFAQAYVLTHLVGHHIQKLLSTTETIPRANAPVDGQLKNSILALELYAELYAGIVFAHYEKLHGHFDENDIEKWLTTVSDIAGNLCKETQDCSIPDPFTHGNIQQRHEWFDLGLKMGDSQRTDLLKGKIGFDTQKFPSAGVPPQ